MKTNNEIVKEAKKSYEYYFKDAKEIPNPKNEDIILDIDKMTKSVQKMKESEEYKSETLKELKEHLEEKAQQSLKNTYGVK